MRNQPLIIVLLLLLSKLAIGQEDSLCIPQCKDCLDVISHKAYYFCYNEDHEQARWVAYELTASELVKTVGRSNAFRADPKVSSSTATNSDYLRSGYDRGHLAPSRDMSWSSITESESYYYSNISPQTPAFNRGIWKELETLTRAWALQHNSIMVVTGPVLESGLPTIGANQVSVPRYFFKALLIYTETEVQAIGFLIPNQKQQANLQTFAISIDSLEKVTQLDFFHALPNELENRVEASLSFSRWSWGASRYYKPTSNLKGESTASQCLGTTSKGLRCKNNTKNQSGYCHRHASSQDNNSSTKRLKRSAAQRCMGTTQKGARCKRRTKNSSGYCWQHD